MSTIAVVGKIKKGKSTLINALLNDKYLLPTDVAICTHKLAFVQYGEKDEAEIILNDLSTEKVSIPMLKELQEDDENKIRRINIFKNNKDLRDHNLVFIDTPGDDVENEQDNIVRKAGIEYADGIIFVLADKTLGMVEKELLVQAQKKQRKVLVVLNKTDQLVRDCDTEEEEIERIELLESEIKNDVHKISPDCRVVSLSALNIIRNRATSVKEKEAYKSLLFWLGSIQSPFDNIKPGDTPEYITELFKKHDFIELLIQNNISGTFYDYSNWKDSIYTDKNIYGGLSVPFHDGNAFVVCVLEEINNIFKFRIALLYSELAYIDKMDFIDNQFHDLGLKRNKIRGFIEGYKFLDFNMSSPKLMALTILEELEKIFK